MPAYSAADMTALLKRDWRGRSVVQPLAIVRLVSRMQTMSVAGSAQTIVPVAPP